MSNRTFTDTRIYQKSRQYISRVNLNEFFEDQLFIRAHIYFVKSHPNIIDARKRERERERVSGRLLRLIQTGATQCVNWGFN